MKIGLTYDLRTDYLKIGFTEEQTVEFDSEETISAIKQALKYLGHEVVRIGNINNLMERLVAGERWDIVFNVCEGLNGRSREAQVPALLEAHKIPYTFSDPLTLAVCLDKDIAKKVIREAGILTPESFTVTTKKGLTERKLRHNLTFPLFVKPVAEGTSKGITVNSIVWDMTELKGQCIKMLTAYNQPVLVEKYIPGREYTVGILGTGSSARVVGVMKVCLLQNAESDVYSYKNKELYEERVRYKLAEEKDIIREASDISLRAYRSLGCRDAGRVDLRADENGRLFFLELNPIAGLHPRHSDLPILCGKVGIRYNELIGEIIHSSLDRNKKASSFQSVHHPAAISVTAGK